MAAEEKFWAVVHSEISEPQELRIARFNRSRQSAAQHELMPTVAYIIGNSTRVETLLAVHICDRKVVYRV